MLWRGEGCNGGRQAGWHCAVLRACMPTLPLAARPPGSSHPASSSRSSCLTPTLPTQPSPQVLTRIADLIEKYADELAAIESLDNGKPLVMSKVGTQGGVGGQVGRSCEPGGHVRGIHLWHYPCGAQLDPMLPCLCSALTPLTHPALIQRRLPTSRCRPTTSGTTPAGPTSCTAR